MYLVWRILDQRQNGVVRLVSLPFAANHAEAATESLTDLYLARWTHIERTSSLTVFDSISTKILF